MSVMSRNALHTPLMVLLQRVHTPGNFSKLADWELRMPRDPLTGYRLFSAKILDAGTGSLDTAHN